MTTTKYFSLMRSTVSFSRKSRAWLYAGVLAIAGMTSLSSCSEYDLDEETTGVALSTVISLNTDSTETW